MERNYVIVTLCICICVFSYMFVVWFRVWWHLPPCRHADFSVNSAPSLRHYPNNEWAIAARIFVFIKKTDRLGRLHCYKRTGQATISAKKVNDKLIRSLSQSLCLSIRSPISRVTLQSSTITIQNVHGVFLSSFPKSTTLKNPTRKLSLSVVAGGGRAFGHGPMVRVRHGKMTQAYRGPTPVSIFVRPTRRRCYRVS